MSTLRPKVVVSSCLLGERVRYDGGHKHLSCLTEHLQEFVDFIPLCPEMLMGLGVPRPPIYAQVRGERIELRVREREIDLTDRASLAAEEIKKDLSEVDGFILKSKSPSCALTALSFKPEEQATSGYFAAQFKLHYPKAHFVDETQIQDAKGLLSFAVKLYLGRMDKAQKERVIQLFSPVDEKLLSLELPAWEELAPLRLLANRLTT